MKKSILTLFTVLLLACSASAAPSAKELKAMGTFLSNFTEIGFFDLNVADMAVEDKIRFGIWHNYINNFKSRIKNCDSCQYGSLRIDASSVAESLKRYMDLNFPEHQSVEQSDPPCHFDGKSYHFEGDDGEAVYYAKVQKVDYSQGIYTATGFFYNADNESDVLGSFEALFKDHLWKGKKTYALISLKSVE